MARPSLRSERGAGMVATMLAVPLVLTLLMAATETLIRLHTRSSVAARAADAVRDAAVEPGPATTTARRASRLLRDDLGRFGDEASIEWRVEPDRIEVRVRVPAPGLIAFGPAGPLARPIEVVASARREVWR